MLMSNEGLLNALNMSLNCLPLSICSQGGEDLSHHVTGQRGVPRCGMNAFLFCQKLNHLIT